MEKNQYELCVEVLARFQKAGVLKDIILIGSWCVPFYKEYFSAVQYPSTIQTRDVDFLVPQPNRIKGRQFDNSGHNTYFRTIRTIRDTILISDNSGHNTS